MDRHGGPRAGRVLTGLSQADGKSRGRVHPTLERAEAGGPIKVADDTMATIAKASEKAGV
jgi:hypothetical protein